MTQTEFINRAFLRTSLDADFFIMVSADKCWHVENCGGNSFFKLWLTNKRDEYTQQDQPIIETCQLKDMFGYHLGYDEVNDLIKELIENGKLGNAIYEHTKIYARDMVYLIHCGWNIALAKERLTIILEAIYKKCNDISNQGSGSVGDFFKTI